MPEESKKIRGFVEQRIEVADERWAVKARADKLRRWFPFAFFVGGFAFDALTLGRVITVMNIVVVALYALGAGIFLVLIGRFSPHPSPHPSDNSPEAPDALPKKDTPPNNDEPIRKYVLPDKWLRWCGFAFHFCLGSLFSALVIMYFKSAGEWLTLLTVLLLFAAMVFNEFARLDESQRHLSWGIYCVSLVMLLNFVVPHLVGSISAWWFYISSILAVGLVRGLCRLAGHPYRMVRVATVAAAALVALYAFGWVPPVPLVLKNTVIGRDFAKIDGEYTCVVDEQTFLVDVGLDAPTVAWKPGERVDVLTAIFAPENIDADMEHRWFRQVDGEWKLTDTIPFHVRGGREEGWRMHSAKRHVSPGLWKVETAVADGAGLGYETFRVERVDEADPPRRGERRAL
jgi:MFS family permease